MPDDITTATRAVAAGDASLRVVGLDHVVLRVADQARSIEFYEKVLGCHVERTLPEIKLVQLRAGAAMIDIVPKSDADTGGRNMDHFAVRIADMDVEALSTHLRRHGIDPGEVRRRYGAEGYGSSIYVTDPDGNTVELKGPPETSAPA
jgi:glyoxylase I family protein